MHEQIVILDFGSQYTQVIARRIRECGVYSTIMRYDTPAAELDTLAPNGIVLSGGPRSVYEPDAPMPDPNIFNIDVPVLGICYGAQIIARFFGGKVEPGVQREYGRSTLKVVDPNCKLFQGLPETFRVWNSHGDLLTRLPPGFHVVGTTENSPAAAIAHREKPIFGLQFHPEVSHTAHGLKILSNFANGICGCSRKWTMRRYVEQAVESIRSQVGREQV
ncbi:MAG: glutamine-hydrolyzing GMP synthase, partial [Verrucomicrobiae bacterium]|nr:glutamine-hydrolyzing GMP synthase [Verrucomicrobiae bacterium]